MEGIVVVVFLDVVAGVAFDVEEGAVEQLELTSWVVRSLRKTCFI